MSAIKSLKTHEEELLCEGDVAAAAVSNSGFSVSCRSRVGADGCFWESSEAERG